MKNLSRFESVQRPSVIGFLIVLEIVIGPTNSSQSDTLQVKSHILENHTKSCYNMGYQKPNIIIQQLVLRKK